MSTHPGYQGTHDHTLFRHADTRGVLRLIPLRCIQTFYSETRAVYQQLDTLKETIYEQEIRLRELELEMVPSRCIAEARKAKEQTLEFLVSEVQKLPIAAPVNPSESEKNQESKSSGLLPSWSGAGVQMMWNWFDHDQDGVLSDLEWIQLKDKLSASHPDIDEVLGLESPTKAPRSPRILLQLYDLGGITELLRDLRALGIYFGSDEVVASAVSECCERLAKAAQGAQLLQVECADLQNEVHEKARTNTRLREAVATTKASLDGKESEIAKMQQHLKQSEAKLHEVEEQGLWFANQKCSCGILSAHRLLGIPVCAFPTRIPVGEISVKLVRAEQERLAATNAVRDLRALVEDQVTEREKWQRYCWELEERLHDAVHTSNAKERDLWKTRDAKKEATRKNMLLYMDAQKGKRHYNPLAAVEPSLPSPRDNNDRVPGSPKHADADKKSPDAAAAANESAAVTASTSGSGQRRS